MAQRYAYKRAFLNKTKDVKSYSAGDLSQILGFAVPDGESAPPPAAQADAGDGKGAAGPPPPVVLGTAKWRGPPPVPSQLRGLMVHMFVAGGFLNNDAK
jgi:hypothetical protein